MLIPASTFIPPYVMIIEPDETLTMPYKLFLAAKKLARFSDLKLAIKELETKPDIVMMSTSWSLAEQYQILERLKSLSEKFETLIPLVLVINLSTTASIVPGTLWGKRIGVLHSFSSNDEAQAMINRMMNQA